MRLFQQIAEHSKDLLFTFYDFPTEHWTHLRTTNPIEGRVRGKHIGLYLASRDSLGPEGRTVPQKRAL